MMKPLSFAAPRKVQHRPKAMQLAWCGSKRLSQTMCQWLGRLTRFA